MKKSYVLTLSGKDKPGMVDRVTKIVSDHKGNVDASRMAHLGGEFAMLMLITAPQDESKNMLKFIDKLKNDGYNIIITPTELNNIADENRVVYKVEVRGADHEGIIHRITHHMAGLGINVEKMDTDMIKAPMSGIPLFMMSAVVKAPDDFSLKDLRADLAAVAHDQNVDIEISLSKNN